MGRAQAATAAVANPGLGLDDWIRLSDEDPVLVSIGEPHKESKGFMKTSVLYTVRTSSKTESHTVVRSYKDFVAFRTVLVKRFAGASVPMLPPTQALNNKTDQFVAKRMHLLEFFMEAVSNNPFFRADDVYTNFVSEASSFDRSLAEGARALESAGSEGFHRWRQALDQSVVHDTERLRDAVSRELEMVRAQLRALRKAGQAQVERMAALAGSSLELYQAFADFYVLERDTIQLVSGPAQLAPATVSGPAREVTMADVLLDASEKMSQYAAVQKSDLYSSTLLEIALVEPVQFEKNMVEMWKDHIDSIGGKIKGCRRADQLVRQLESDEASLRDKIAREGDPKGRLTRNLENIQRKTLPDAQAMLAAAEQDLVAHERGLLGIELTRYRAARTLRMEKIVETITRLQLRGLDELIKVFDGTGSRVRLGRDPKGHVVVTRNENAGDGSALDRDDDGSSFGASLSFASESEAGSTARQLAHQRRHKKFSFMRMGSTRRGKAPVNDPEALLSAAIGDAHRDRSHQMSTAANMRDGTRLRVREEFTASRSDELDVSAGEVLSARRVDDAMWYATNARGQAGLVPSRVVEVASAAQMDAGDGVLRPGSVDRRRSKQPPAPPQFATPEAPAAPPGLKDADRAHIEAVSRAAARQRKSRTRVDRDHRDDDDDDERRASRRQAKKDKKNARKSKSRRESRKHIDDEDDDDNDDLDLAATRRSGAAAAAAAAAVARTSLSKSSKARFGAPQDELDHSGDDVDDDDNGASSHSRRRASKSKAKSKSRSKSRARSKSRSKAAASSQLGGPQVPEGARPAAGMLADIAGFNRSQLRHEDSDDAANRRRQQPAFSRPPTNPMEELMQKLAFREKVE